MTTGTTGQTAAPASDWVELALHHLRFSQLTLALVAPRRERLDELLGGLDERGQRGFTLLGDLACNAGVSIPELSADIIGRLGGDLQRPTESLQAGIMRRLRHGPVGVLVLREAERLDPDTLAGLLELHQYLRSLADGHFKLLLVGDATLETAMTRAEQAFGREPVYCLGDTPDPSLTTTEPEATATTASTAPEPATAEPETPATPAAEEAPPAEREATAGPAEAREPAPGTGRPAEPAPRARTNPLSGSGALVAIFGAAVLFTAGAWFLFDRPADDEAEESTESLSLELPGQATPEREPPEPRPLPDDWPTRQPAAPEPTTPPAAEPAAEPTPESTPTPAATDARSGTPATAGDATPAAGTSEPGPAAGPATDAPGEATEATPDASPGRDEATIPDTPAAADGPTERAETSPATSPDPIAGRDWFDRQPAGHFTIQLIALASADELTAFADRHGLPRERLARFRQQRGGRTLHVLTLGAYPDRSSAQSAVADLPPAVRRLGPWIRTIASVREAADG